MDTRRTIRGWIWIAAALVGVASSGCASFERRGVAAFSPDKVAPWTIYPGTLQDGRTIRAAFGGDNLGGNAWLKAPVAIVDLPLSITADTICLPYDAVVVLNEPGPESPHVAPAKPVTDPPARAAVARSDAPPPSIPAAEKAAD